MFDATESVENGLYVYTATGLDSLGSFTISAKSIAAWPNEGFNEIKKTYTNGGMMMLMGVFSPVKPKPIGID